MLLSIFTSGSSPSEDVVQVLVPQGHPRLAPNGGCTRGTRREHNAACVEIN